MATVTFASVNTMIEQLRSDDVEARLHSVMGLRVIAQALGPERVRSELLPFLSDYLDDNDEVQRAFAGVLGSFLPEVGGLSHIRDVLNPLELMAATDDVTVREAAADAINRLAGAAFASEGSAEPQQEVVSVVMRLVKSELPQARCCACGCLAVLYRSSSVAVKVQLRQSLQRLCADEELMVRRAAVVALGGDVPAALGPQAVELLPSVNSLAKDASDGVRLHVVAAVLKLLPFVSDAAGVQLSGLLRVLGSDAAWRVRYMVADRIGDMCAAISPTDVMKLAVPLFKALSQDPEAEIRAACVPHAHDVLRACADASGKKDVLSAALRLVKDANAHVRVGVAGSVLLMAAHAAKEAWTTLILPACTTLLGDTDPDVRLALVSSYGAAAAATTTVPGGAPVDLREVAPKLVPSIVALTSDPKWRVRSTVVAQLPTLVAQLGKNNAEVVGIVVKSLQDHVAAIRNGACDACAEMAATNGSAWVKATLLPLILPLASAGGYVRRVTIVRLLVKLVPHVDAAAWKAGGREGAALAATVAALAADSVANVRMATAALVGALQAHAPSREADALMARLASDVDVDVRDAAKVASRR